MRRNGAPAGGQRVATSQPAQRNAMQSNPAAAGVRPKPAPMFDEPPKNETLLRYSAIAVEAPKVEKIKVHDLITIIIREDKQSTTDARTKSEKDWKVESEFKKWFRLNKEDHLVGQEFPQPTPGVDFDFQNEWEGKGKVDRRDSLTTRITATVIDVKPNGNLILEARKTISSDEETQTVTLTGECRVADVSPQNTILSTQIASLEVTAKHSGAARDAAKRGWLMRAFDFLRPI
jgi:flagellar L-ring protein precursor FlgH